MPAPPVSPLSILVEPSTDSERRRRSPSLPARGRHSIGVARIALRRIAVPRVRIEELRCRRLERRREQLPLPPGFVDRRAA